jgi:hypothetical protein
MVCASVQILKRVAKKHLPSPSFLGALSHPFREHSFVINSRRSMTIFIPPHRDHSATISNASNVIRQPGALSRKIQPSASTI